MDLLEEIKEQKKQIIQKILNRTDKTQASEFNGNNKLIQILSCEDTDSIPKISDAGKVFENDSEPYYLMHNGMKLVYDDNIWMADLILGLRGHFEPNQEKVFYEVLKSMPAKAVMIELGCGAAYYSIWFNKEVAEPMNYLIEPSVNGLEVAKKSCALNQMKGTFIQGYVKPIRDPRYIPNPGILPEYRDAENIQIDAFLKKNQIEHVNILHADIQGSEYDMLRTAIKSINSRKIDYFFISTHYQTHPKCLTFLKSHGLKIVAEHSIEEGYEIDGLIVAKQKDVPGPDYVSISKKKRYTQGNINK